MSSVTVSVVLAEEAPGKDKDSEIGREQEKERQSEVSHSSGHFASDAFQRFLRRQSIACSNGPESSVQSTILPEEQRSWQSPHG